MVKRVYVDTSVVGGIFDAEFSEMTVVFWNAVVRGDFVVVVSDILERELEHAPAPVRDFLSKLPEKQMERVSSTPEVVNLARRYIAEKVVGETSLDDCQHIALATIVNADCLVSWNFKHIVNLKRIRGYNGVNLLLGYRVLEIRTPYEVLDEQI